ncbi:MAG: glycosyltransferase family 1 protein [Alphaproteobacteria bacterium]|nr:glycosyltransferase family 1 protein [Alphaproteobacteria bacterium]
MRGLTAPLDPQLGQERPLRILIATDAWTPQVNGVVRTLETLRSELLRMGHDVRMITPELFSTVPMPTYPEIKLAIFPGSKVRRIMNAYGADTVHIATEGPIGLAVRRYCRLRGIRFTTSFHTRFPEYVHARFGVPTSWSYAALRWFHNPSSAVMVATHSLKDELHARGFFNLRLWSRGVDVELFKPRPKDCLDLPRPIWLYVGRVAVEKNVESFLALDLPGTKLIIGDGPMLTELKVKFPAAHFTGPKFGEELARYYSASDVFVFPSKTDTFGLVILEALASGIPVAAYPVQGPLDVIGEAPVGALDEDLARACARALTVSGADAREFAMNFSWEACTRQFLSNLSPQRPEAATVPGP